MSNQEKINSLFNLQHGHKRAAKNTSARYRLKKLKAFKNDLLKKKDMVANAIIEDFRKPPVETDLTEIMPIISMINLLEKNLSDWMKDEKVKTPLLFKGTSSWVRFEGKGNCLIISPWNYPFQLTMYPILTAFAAGNTCIVKPSEFTPSTNKAVMELCSDIFSEEEVAFIEGDSSVSSDLLKLPFDHIFFTGSTPVGKIVAEAAAKNLASCSLELGGKSPCVVDKDANIDKLSNKIAWGKMVNGGQTCVAPDYLLVEKGEEDKVASCLVRHIESFYPKLDFSSSNDYCQIITERHGERLMKMVDDAVSKGANLVCGGKYHPETRVMEPTIITNVTNDMKLMQEEIFGPVLPIVSATSRVEMANFINDFDNALAMYIFTESDEFQNYFLENTFSGGVTINDTLIGVGHPLLPFGGAGKSGIGKYHGKYGFEEFSNLRSVTKRSLDLGTSYFYPPYDEKKSSVVDSLLKKFSKVF